jgi:site-specific DNA-adenine methylase
MRYPGGKFRCFQRLINLIPPHRVYIETHLGGGAVLRNKTPAEYSIGIDRDPEVIRAFCGLFGSNFQFSVRSAEDFIRGYRFIGDEFIYADPPYFPASRRSPRSPYRFDYTAEDHVNFLTLVRSVSCSVMISGYDSAVYARELKGWHRLTFTGTSHKGKRQEVVWLNYLPNALHDIRFLGDTFRQRQTIKRKRARWVARFRNEPTCVQQAVLADLQEAFGERIQTGVQSS